MAEILQVVSCYTGESFFYKKILSPSFSNVSWTDWSPPKNSSKKTILISKLLKLGKKYPTTPLQPGVYYCPHCQNILTHTDSIKDSLYKNVYFYCSHCSCKILVKMLKGIPR